MTFAELLDLLRKRLVFIVAIPVACALIAAAYAYLVLPDTYTATTSMYVLTSESVGATGSVNTELSASQMVSNDVARILRSDRVRREAAEMVGLDSLAGYSVSVSSDNNTRVITLNVSGHDAQMTASIANAMTRDVAAVAQEVMGIKSVNVIDPAEVPSYISGPNRRLYILVAFVAGLLVTIAGILIVDMADTRVSKAEEASDLLGLPVIGRFPISKEVQ